MGRVEEGGILLHQARRVRPLGALVALLDHREGPNLGAAVAAAAPAALVGAPGEWLRNIR